MWIQAALAALMVLGLGAVVCARRFRVLRGIASTSVRRRALGTGLALLCVLSGANYFLGSRSGNFLHHWDLFHTVMTSRYFSELGYTRLYECTLALDESGPGRLVGVRRIRDLRSLDLVTREDALARTDCSKRFSRTRRAEFLRDMTFWMELAPNTSHWRRLMQDKGYNGTPLYGALVNLLVGEGPLSRVRLTWLATIDVLLLLVAFGTVAFAYNGWVGGIAFIFFCVNFPGCFVHMGGSILRFDYVAALVIGVCLLRRRHYGGGGIALAWASMQRVFPFAFVAGIGVGWVFSFLSRRRLHTDQLRFLAGFTATVAICFVASLSMGGFDGWADFVGNIELHTQRSAGFRIGFRHMFMLDGNWASEVGFVGYEAKEALWSQRRLFFYAACGLLLLPVVATARRRAAADNAILIGLAAFFALTIATRYYYSVLVLLFMLSCDFRRNAWYGLLWLALFAASLLGLGLGLRRAFPPLMYNVVYGVVLTAIFVLIGGYELLFRSQDPGVMERC